MKVSHMTLVTISGLVWLAVGAFLLPFGLHLMMASAFEANLGTHYPLFSLVSDLTGNAEQAALFITALCLFIGYLKGSRVLSKSVHRSIVRIRQLPSPASLGRIYSPGYYLLLGGMIAIGMSIKFFGLSEDIRGAVDIAVGVALINGAMLYFREAYALRPVKVKAD